MTGHQCATGWQRLQHTHFDSCNCNSYISQIWKMIDALPNVTQVGWLWLLFSEKNPEENILTSLFAANQQVFTNKFCNANIARQPFHLYSLDMKVHW